MTLQTVQNSTIGSTIKLTVIGGPDLGKVASFDKEHVTLGRDVHNDFVLTDGFVSNWHGELMLEHTSFVYYDLRSRHGTLVLIDDVSINLHDANHVRHVRVVHGSEIQVGSTLIRLDITTAARRSSQVGALRSYGTDDKYITAAHRPIEDWTSDFGQTDDEVQILLRLANQLNRLNRIEDILDLIVETTFEAFSSANFFAISLIGEDGELTPFVVRSRNNVGDIPEGVILSQSILQRVVEIKESILFVRDHVGTEISQSILEAQITACLCAPLVGQRSLIGVVQADTRGHGSLFSRKDLDLFSVLASSTAFAIERAKMSEDIFNMFESFVQASVTAIEARDPTTAGHSQRVAQYTMALADCASASNREALRDLTLTPQESTELRYAALLHDFGKVGVSESVLNKRARLDETAMVVIAQRFANFKSIAEIRAWRALADKTRSEGRAPDEADLEAVRAQVAQESEALDQQLKQINEARSVSYLNDEAADGIREIGAQTVTNLDGTPLPKLLEEELVHLTVQKGNLTEPEWIEMRSHSAKSEEYLDQIPWSVDLRRIPWFAGLHHEKLDGSGYPKGVSADQIPPQVRMMTIADIYDAITASDRPYKKSSSHEFAVKVLRSEAEKGQLDGPLVELFIDEVVPKFRAKK